MHLLFIANFAADTGYAWDTIEAVFRRVGERLVADGHQVTVAYAAMPNGPSRRMRGAPFDFITFDYGSVKTAPGLRDFLALLRARSISALYLTDHETWSPRYALFRRAGVQRIIIHDRTSGERTRRSGPLQTLKQQLNRVAAISADCYIGVSQFVRRRLIEVSGTPPGITHLVYNGIEVEPFDLPAEVTLHDLIGVPNETSIVFCSGRAQPYKGFQTVIDAAAVLRGDAQRLAFVYCGDGPYASALRTRVADLELANFFFLGRRSDVPQLLRSASIAVVPSLWAEAFGLTVVEAMVAGVPLIATRTGGIPELVEEGVTGVLVQPGDAAALAGQIRGILASPDAARRRAERASVVARDRFSIERVTGELHRVLAPLLQPNGKRTRVVDRPAIGGEQVA